MSAAPGWAGQAAHRAWLDQHCRDLLAFGRACPAPGGGAAWLDGDGAPDPERGIHTWITARMTHVYSLGHLLGVPGCGPLADRALAGLWDAARGAGGQAPLRDREHGGWCPSRGPDGRPAPGKAAYDHAFVVLAAATATAAARPGARDLLGEALAVYEQRFWDEATGMPVDRWDASFTELDRYRGTNAAMHSVEAALAAADVLDDVLGDPAGSRAWRGRAERMAVTVAGWARENGWRVPEHFSADPGGTWRVELEHHADVPADPFTPYGATVGHGFEWARLLLHVEAAASAAGRVPPVDLLPAARELFARAAEDGWAVDGRAGFVYTTDWSSAPVVRDRMHWVPAEAIAAAAALARRTGEGTYAERYAAWWDHVEDEVVDHERGSWRHQIDQDGATSATVWPGKPDLYHAVGATLVPRLPLAPCHAVAVRRGVLVT